MFQLIGGLDFPDFENQNFIDILNDNRNYHTFKLNYKF